MVTMQISVSETTAELLAQTVRDRQFADPSEYIEGLIEADHVENLDIDRQHKNETETLTDIGDYQETLEGYEELLAQGAIQW